MMEVRVREKGKKGGEPPQIASTHSGLGVSSLLVAAFFDLATVANPRYSTILSIAGASGIIAATCFVRGFWVSRSTIVKLLMALLLIIDIAILSNVASRAGSRCMQLAGRR